MTKMSLLGQDQSQLIDCSEVIPVPQTINVKATFPAGLSNKDIEQAVRSFYLRTWTRTDMFVGNSAPQPPSPLLPLTQVRLPLSLPSRLPKLFTTNSSYILRTPLTRQSLRSATTFLRA